MQVMSSTRRFQILLFLLASFGARLCQAFEFDIPSTVMVGIPITVGYTLTPDDPRRWRIDLTDGAHTKLETLSDGDVFEATELTGEFSVTVDREGIFCLRAVDAEKSSNIIATSLPNMAWEGIGQRDEDEDVQYFDENGNQISSIDDTEVDPDDEIEATSLAASATKTRAKTKAKVDSDADEKSKSKPNIAAIVGGVIAAVIVLMLIFCAILFFVRQRKQTQQKPTRRVTFYRDRMVQSPTEKKKGSPLVPESEKRATGKFSPKKVPPPLPIPILINPHDHPTYAGYTRDAYPAGGPAYPLPAPPLPSPRMREFLLSPRSPPSIRSPRIKELMLSSPRPQGPRESDSYSRH